MKLYAAGYNTLEYTFTASAAVPSADGKSVTLQQPGDLASTNASVYAVDHVNGGVNGEAYAQNVSIENGKIALSKTLAAGDYRVVIANESEAGGTDGTYTFTVAKAPAEEKVSQTITAKKTTFSVKAKNLKKANKTFTVKLTANGGGKVTCAAAKTAGGKVKIAKNGQITVKKGTKVGAYTLNVKATAAAKGNYAKTKKTVELTVKVTK